MRIIWRRLDLGGGNEEACGVGISRHMESKMKHLVYAVVAAAAVAFSAGAFACEGQHTASSDSKMVVAQQQSTTQGSASQSTASQSK